MKLKKGYVGNYTWKSVITVCDEYGQLTAWQPWKMDNLIISRRNHSCLIYTSLQRQISDGPIFKELLIELDDLEKVDIILSLFTGGCIISDLFSRNQEIHSFCLQKKKIRSMSYSFNEMMTFINNGIHVNWERRVIKILKIMSW